MKLEDPRFLVLGVCLGILCAWTHTPLVLALAVGAIWGLFWVPPFVFNNVLGFWKSYSPSQFITIRSILMDRSNIPFRRAWVMVAALILLATTAVLFGLGMAEFALPRWFNRPVADRAPLSTAMVMLCVYVLFKILTWWAKRQQ